MRLSRKVLIAFLLLSVILGIALYFFPFDLMGGRKYTGGLSYVIVKECSFSSQDSLSGWDEKALAPRKTEYSLYELDGEKSLKASADDSASTFYYKERLAFQRRPFVGWEWKAETFPTHKEKETLSKKAEFDFAAQFYVMFYSKFFLKTKAIQYVWAESLPVGTTGDNPYTANVKMIVLESGKPDGWKHEERNIALDYRTLFGEPLDKDVVAVAFMTDADSTDSAAAAFYRNIQIGYMENAPEKIQELSGPQKLESSGDEADKAKDEGVSGKVSAPEEPPADTPVLKDDKGKEQPSST